MRQEHEDAAIIWAIGGVAVMTIGMIATLIARVQWMNDQPARPEPRVVRAASVVLDVRDPTPCDMLRSGWLTRARRAVKDKWP